MKIISLKNINKTFEKNKVLCNFNLEIEEKEFLCIMGTSGSGKSTLLNIIGLLDRPDSGVVTICEKINPKINSREGILLLRNKISYLFQNYGLIESETVGYNLKISMRFLKLNKKEKEIRAKEALEKMGLKNIINKKVYCLSGGEQQRVALAKVMLKPSRIILADEPTGSLDSGNKEIVMGFLKSLNREGKTIVLVTHDDTIKKYASRIITITRHQNIPALLTRDDDKAKL